MKPIVFLSIVTFVFLAPSCKPGIPGKDTASDEALASSPGKVEISREQFKMAEMEIGNPAPAEFKQSIRSRGNIIASPAGHIRITTSIAGRVRQIHTLAGTYVRQGQELFSLEGQEIIILQQEYAASFHKLKAIRSDYERKKVLASQDIGSRKELGQAESEYLSLLSIAEGLKARLELLRIDPEEVEQGSILSHISIPAPTKGYVTNQDLVLGQYLQPYETAMEIINPDHFSLHLHLFESDLQDVTPGLPVRFYKPDSPEKIFEGRLTLLGKTIDPETKTVLCIAEISPEDCPKFVQHLFVEASIITCYREAPSIPEDALILEEGKYYVLRLIDETPETLEFERTLVQIGTIQGGLAEILDVGLDRILLRGLYSLSASE